MTGAKPMKRKRDRTQPVNWSAPEDRLASLQAENWQLKQELGYPIPADKETPQNPFKCGTCEASHMRAEAAEAREQALRDALEKVVRLIDSGAPGAAYRDARAALSQETGKP